MEEVLSVYSLLLHLIHVLMDVGKFDSYPLQWQNIVQDMGYSMAKGYFEQNKKT